MKNALSVLSSSSAHAADSCRTRHRTHASWILTVVVLCDRFRHPRDDSLLHTPLIDVLWPFPSLSHDECSVLTRRALVSLSSQTRISFGNLDDLVTPRFFGCEAGCTRTLGISSRAAVRQAVVARVCISVGCCSLSFLHVPI